MDSRDVSTGRTAVAAGVLMAAGVAAEWVLSPQQENGVVADRLVLTLLVTTTTTGYGLLFLAVRGLRAEAARRTRPARSGAFMSMTGAAVLAVFGLAFLATALVMGAPFEPLFVAFALGMLLLAAGPVTWGLSMRRQSGAPGVWQLLVASGVAAFAAIAIPFDPWHDVSLTAMFAAWTALGVCLVRGDSSGRGRSRTTQPVSTAG
jgi:hypothetical protein